MIPGPIGGLSLDLGGQGGQPDLHSRLEFRTRWNFHPYARRLSTGSRCCSVSLPVLASNCMMNCLNSTTRRQSEVEPFTLPPDAPQPIERVGDRASSGDGFSHAVRTRPQKASPFARLFDSRRLRRASAKYLPLLSAPKPSANIMSTSPAKLDSRVSHPQSITSHFLIDNFQQVSSRVAGSSSSASFASLASSASFISNRPCPRLEMLVSPRKQTFGPVSNRPKFAFCNLPLAAPKQPVHPDAGRAAKRACPPKHVFAKRACPPKQLFAKRACPPKQLFAKRACPPKRVFAKRACPPKQLFAKRACPPKRVFAKRACPPKRVFAKAGRSQLSTVACGLPSLIANETHSRKRPSTCKQSTYQFLIANENQRAALTLIVAEGPGNAPLFLFITIDLPHPALDSRLLTFNWQRRAFLPLAHRSAIIAPENLYRSRGEIRRRDWGNETWH